MRSVPKQQVLYCQCPAKQPSVLFFRRSGNLFATSRTWEMNSQEKGTHKDSASEPHSLHLPRKSSFIPLNLKSFWAIWSNKKRHWLTQSQNKIDTWLKVSFRLLASLSVYPSTTTEHSLPNHHIHPQDGHRVVNLNPKMRKTLPELGPKK